MFIHKKEDLAVIVKKNNGLGKIEIPALGRIKKIKLNGNAILILDEEKEIEVDHQSTEVFYRHSNDLGIKLDASGYGPRSLARTYHDLGGIISQYIDEYIRIFGERPESIG
jgi:hypothetical protein